MSVHSNPLKVFVANSVAANSAATGIPTIAANDVLLLDRALTVLSSDTIAGDVNNDLIYVALGTAAGVAKTVAIPTKGIKKVTTSLYQAPTQHSVKIVAANALGTIVVGQNYNIKVFFHDTHRQMDDKEGRAFFSYTAKTGDDATAVLTGLRNKINAVTYNKQVSAALDGSNNLVITGLAVTDNAFGLPQFRYFDVALRSGFKADFTAVTISGSVAAAGTEALVITPGIVGKGSGSIVKHMELKGIYDFNRTQWPLGTDTRLASESGFYNTVTIQYETTNTSAFNRLASNQQTLVIAFAAAETTTTTAMDAVGETPIQSLKQVNFLAALASLVESAGVAFVS